MPLASENALQKYMSGLQAHDYSDTQSTVDEVLREVQLLEERHSANSKIRIFGRRIHPLVKFLTRYGPVVDTLVQYDPTPSALVWGAIKGLLEAARTSIRYYQSIADTILSLTDIVSIASQYETIFGQESRVCDALTDVYFEILVFLRRIRKILTKNSLRALKSVFRPFDFEFAENVQRLSRSVKIYEQEVELAHRKHAEIHIRNQEYSSRKMAQKLETIAFSISQENEDYRSHIMTWLNPGDYFEVHHRAAAKRTLGTGQWLLEEPTFHKWLSGSDESLDSSIFWLQGSPGTGKSILCSIVIDYLQQYSYRVPTVYFYCESQSNSKVSSRNVYTSLLSQLLAQAADVPPALKDAYRLARRYGRTIISTADRVPELLRSILDDIPSLNIVIDALDECSEIEEVSNLLCATARSLPYLRVMFSSRDQLTIRNQLAGVPSLRLDGTRTRRDIDRYLEQETKILPCSDESLKQRALSTLSEKADGMFLFAYLGVQTLKSAVNVCDMLEALEKLPRGLDNVYGLILDRFAMDISVRRDLVRRIFLWVCSCVRPLTWPELQSALSWDPETRTFSPDKAPFKDVVLELCYPLIDHRSETDTFRLTHLSVYEFLHEPANRSHVSPLAAYFLFDNESAHLQLSKTTLRYMRKEEISSSIEVDNKLFPLTRYATDNWGFHLSSASFDSSLHIEYKDFVSSRDRRLNWIARSLISEHWPFPLQRIIGIQNQMRIWAANSGERGRLPIDDLIDTQKALFLLDDFRTSKCGSDPRIDSSINSKFERIMVIRELAREYTMIGQLEVGIKMFEDELAKVKENEAGFSPSRSWLMSSLGILYDQQGRTQDAEEIQRRVLTYQEQHLPDDHLDIILTISELGRICRHLEKYEEAEKLHRRALATLRGVFPDNDTHINWTKNALARCLLKSGRPAEALELHTEAYSSELQLLGKDHLHVVWTLSDIARCYRDLGRIIEAIENQREVLDRRERVLGTAHPDTSWAMNSLALLCEANGELIEARKLHESAYRAQTLSLGDCHAHTVWSAKALERLKLLQ